MKTEFDFHIQRSLLLFSSARPEKANKSFKNYGGFRFHLEFENVDGKVIVKRI